MEHVRWLAQPSLQRPILIAAFTGWNDAADAASNSVRHLVEAWQAQPLAEIDPEEFTDFATVRPHVRLTPEQRRTIVWPTVGAWSASTPGGDVILVLGPEPALRWRLFTQQLIGIAQQFDVSMVLTLGALLADFRARGGQAIYLTGIVGVVQDACTRADLSCASLWAAVPAYASQVPSPKASLALVERACEIIGTPAPTSRLHADAIAYDARVSAFVADDADLVGYVERLESLSDSGQLDDHDFDEDDDDDDDDTVGGELAAEPEVNSEAFMAELERFLRDQEGDGK